MHYFRLGFIDSELCLSCLLLYQVYELHNNNNYSALMLLFRHPVYKKLE